MTAPDEEELRRRAGRLSLRQKVRLLTGADFWALHPEPAVGLRRVVTSDGPAGVRGVTWDERDTSANVPSPTALAATWDTGRVEGIGRLLAAEARRKGVDVLLAPTVNLHRTPYAGRHFECFSEDPLLTARIGAAYLRGLQRCGVGGCVKHFVANDSETQRMSVDVRVDERTLRELYLAPFEAMLCPGEGGERGDEVAWSAMAAYNGVNGTTMTESPLLRDILHAEWGWDGLLVSDWTAARSVVPAARAALDLAMPGPADRFGPWGDALVQAVAAGQVGEELIEEKVVRILRLAARVGALEGFPAPAPPPARSAGEVAGELRAAAAASFVLARNDSCLPLERGRLGRVALIGPNAETARTQGGGSATVHPPYAISPLDGLRAAGLDVCYAPGVLEHLRVPAARAPWLLRPGASGDPGPGSEVRFFTASGELAGVQQRDGATFRWMAGFGLAEPAGPVARLEVRCRVRATGAGAYSLGVSGLGQFRLLVDGTEVFDVTLAMRPGADLAEVLMLPPQHLAPVELAAGQTAEVVLEHDVRSSPMAAFGTMLALDLCPPHGADEEEIAAAVWLAAAADTAVVVVGTTAEVESEGFDRASLALPGRQDELVRRVAAASRRTVVVVNSGAPVLLPWAGQVDAVLLTWFGGQEFGHALADVLLGDAEPGGRLPTSWPATEAGLPSTQPVDGVLAYAEQMFIGYRGYDRDGRQPLFPFGHGGGYTTWSYDQIAVGGGAVRVGVRNTGPRRGREVVQVYASRPDSAVLRPVKWLAGFAVAEADPGEAVTVAIPLPERTFQHWSEAGWAVEAGRFTVAAGPSSAVLPLTASIDVQA